MPSPETGRVQSETPYRTPMEPPAAEEAMYKLTIIYDETCAFCVRCRWWMARQPAYTRLEFLPRSSREIARRFPSLAAEIGQAGRAADAPQRASREGLVKAELIAIVDDEQIYREANAWIMCLFALVEYREWALRLAHPALAPFAEQFFIRVSKRRHWLSRLVGGSRQQAALERALERQHESSCRTCRGAAP